jgi:hypothetical protein
MQGFLQGAQVVICAEKSARWGGAALACLKSTVGGCPCTKKRKRLVLILDYRKMHCQGTGFQVILVMYAPG